MTNIQNKYMGILIAFASSFLMGINASGFDSDFYNLDIKSYRDFTYEQNQWKRCKRASQFVVGHGCRFASWGFFISRKCSGFTKDFLNGSANTLWKAYANPVKESSYPSKTGELGTKAFFLTGYIIALIGKKTAEWSEIGMNWAENAYYDRYKGYLAQLEKAQQDNAKPKNSIVIY